MKVVLFALIVLAGVHSGTAAALLKDLRVEYRETPLGIDVAQPRFSWQMATTAGERGYSQAAYQVQVKDAKNNLLWDSRRTEDSNSVGVKYNGPPLQPATRYIWAVDVWTQAGARLSASSWFETGLMDPAPDSRGWSGAKWIGGGDGDLVLYAQYLEIFNASYSVAIAPGSTRASFIYGANDSRLMDKYKNIYQVQNGRDQSYIKLELDIAGVDEAGTARLNVYRAGYTDSDSASKPLRTFEIPGDVINSANKNSAHVVSFRSAFGQLSLSIDGKAALGGAPPGGRGGASNSVNLNPVGSGGDFIAFGMLCDIGFSVDAGQSASFRDVTIRNNRSPNNILFHEDPAGAYRGIFADAAAGNSGFSVADGQYILKGRDHAVFVARDPSRNSMPMLRTSFRVADKAIQSARLYVTARGIYEVFLNGSRVGEDYYNPGLTQYNITHMYQTYDVTALLKPGDNGMGAMLGEGWWSGLLGYVADWNHFGDRQSLLAKLRITYADGSSDTVVTNPQSWKYYNNGPIVYSSLDMGEIYDSSREAAVENWSNAGYNDSRWKPAVVVPLAGTAFTGLEGGPGGQPIPFTFDKLSLIAQIGNNAGVFKTLTAQSVSEVRPGVYVYNLGQNIVGVPRITIANGRAGAKIAIRFAEMLYPDLPESRNNVGMIMTENYRAAISTDVYTMKTGSQVFQPRFTSHGFQYVEITGLDKPLPPAAVQGLAISSVRRLTADYKTSNEKVNHLWSNLVWSNIDNFLTIPTDCPQRNERMGWSGDISVFSRTATYVSNADQFLTRHMYAMRDVQSTAGRFTDVAPIGGGFGGILWGSAGIVVPWETYLQYADAGLLERHYPAMAAYMNYLETTIDPATGLSSDGQLGDWLGPQNDLLGSAYLATAYHAYDLGIVAKVAEILGKNADAAKYRDWYEKRRAYFDATFVNPEKKTLATSGRGGRGAAPPQFHLADTQTSYAIGLGMNLFPDGDKPAMASHLADSVTRENTDDGGKMRPPFSLMTGFIGTSWIMQALSNSGHSDLAYKLLENEQYPSWLYAIDQGATSIWERLNGYTVENGFGGNNGMNSFNHYSFGAVGQWLMAYSLGIQRDQPGFKKFILQPEPDPSGGMTSAEGYYDSMYGRIASAWKVSGKTLTYRATVPANTTATLYLPAASATAVQEGGRDAGSAAGVKFIRYENGTAVYSLQSGDYEFTSAM